MAGLVAVYIFAVQMLNFPVAAGTSGHLLGGALAAILVGPYTGALAVSVVIIVQALMFADGGLSALGLNIINMAFVTVLVAWPIFRLLVKVLPASKGAWMGAAFVAGLLSVPAAALAFTLEYALGGTGTYAHQHRPGRDGRHPRPDRPRGGCDHRTDRGGGAGGATRSCPRGARPVAQARAAALAAGRLRGVDPWPCARVCG